MSGPDVEKLAPLNDLARDFASFRGVLRAFSDVPDPQLQARATNLQTQLGAFSAKVTLVGQVKAGKTSLTNALIGAPQLLPSDVNPWTSVATTIHLNTPPPRGRRAVFKFHEKDDWDKLMESGGRLGQMAQRVSANKEMDELTQQLKDLRLATEKRLGANFEMLLGNGHHFTDFTPELIERYVCFGDEEDGEERNRQGRFAELTKSAEIYIEDPRYQIPVSYCDTPGVNDPFLVREQVTLNSLNDTDVCVIVLSAHQALTTMDLALMRILLALHRDQLVLFINRIDELASPAETIPEIETQIRDTLKNRGMLEDIPIIFGSALWAEAVATNTLDDLPKNSRSALMSMIEADGGSTVDMDPLAYAAEFCGVPALEGVVAGEIREGPGRRMLVSIHNETTSIAQQSLVLMSRANLSDQSFKTTLDEKTLADRLDKAVDRHLDAASTAMDTATENLVKNLKDKLDGYVDTEMDALSAHLSGGGKMAKWAADVGRLRQELKAAFDLFTEEFETSLKTVFQEFAVEIEDSYHELFSGGKLRISLPLPEVPAVPAPVVLAQTLALDMGGSWFTRWFRGKSGVAHYQKEFRRIAMAEVEPVIKVLEEEHALTAINEARLILRNFAYDHCETLLQSVALGSSEVQADAAGKLEKHGDVSGSIDLLSKAIEALSADTAAPAAPLTAGAGRGKIAATRRGRP